MRESDRWNQLTDDQKEHICSLVRDALKWSEQATNDMCEEPTCYHIDSIIDNLNAALDSAKRAKAVYDGSTANDTESAYARS